MKFLKTILIITFLWSCSSEDNESEYTNIPLEFKTPSNFPPTTFNFQNNPLTQKGFELGKKLFYDGRLSSDGIVSCGFCHEQASAFTHHGHTFSHGINNLVGTRNTPPIQNMAFQSSFMWDGAVNNLDLLSILPITNPVEMNGDFATIIAKLKSDPEYQKLFKVAFTDGQINSENMLKALGQFMVMVTSSKSKFDKFRRNEAGGNMTTDELQGYTIFNQKCTSCHATDIFTDNSFRNNGLPINPAIDDKGYYKIAETVYEKLLNNNVSRKAIEVSF